MKEWSEAILEEINSLGNEATLKQIYAALEGHFPLSNENLSATRYGGRKAYEHEVRSFASDLAENGDLERTGRGRYRLTSRGTSRLRAWMEADGRALHEPKVHYVASPPTLRLIDVEVEPLEEGGYMAVCDSIQGCRAEGETVGEALGNIEDVARVLLELRKEKGQPVPEGLESFEPGRILRAQLIIPAVD